MRCEKQLLAALAFGLGESLMITEFAWGSVKKRRCQGLRLIKLGSDGNRKGNCRPVEGNEIYRGNLLLRPRVFPSALEDSYGAGDRIASGPGLDCIAGFPFRIQLHAPEAHGLTIITGISTCWPPI